MSKTNYWQKFEEGVCYHIYNRTINKERLFRSDDNYIYFLRKWKILLDPYLATRAYCLLPNHFHFQVKVRIKTSDIEKKIKLERTQKSMKFLKGEISYNEFLEDQFKRLFSAYVLAFNKQHNRKGSLFQKRFKRVSFNKEESVFYNLGYIHHNPIHHNVSSDFKEWRWSSYNAYLSDKPSSVNKPEVFDWFDSTPQKALIGFLVFHKAFRIEKRFNDGIDIDDF